MTGDEEHAGLILRMCAMVAQGRLDTWDCQWTLGQLLQGGLAVVPAVNLVANIGFGHSATHTREPLALTAQHAYRAYYLPLEAADPSNRRPGVRP